MINDRELLELAAKACGFEILSAFQAQRDKFLNQEHKGLYIKNGSFKWNPIKNDGDALRLAIDLSIQINTFENRNGWFAETTYYIDGIYNDEHVAFGDDKYAAIRRAIVLSAANIGKHTLLSNANPITQ